MSVGQACSEFRTFSGCSTATVPDVSDELIIHAECRVFPTETTNFKIILRSVTTVVSTWGLDTLLVLDGGPLGPQLMFYVNVKQQNEEKHLQRFCCIPR